MTEYEFEVQGFYAGSWEMVTTEDTRAAADEQRRCYDENEPGVPHRVRRVKVENNG